MTPASTSATASTRRPLTIMLALLGALALLALAALAMPQLWYPLWFDQGAFAACAQALRAGGVMYRDCWDVRGPAAALAYLIPLLVSPSPAALPIAIHAFDLLCQAATALLLGLLAARLFNRRAGVVAGMLYWLLYASINYWATAQAESFANLFVVLALYTAVRDLRLPIADLRLRPAYDNRQSSIVNRQLLLSGACIGILFWFKYPFLLVGLLPLLLIAWRARRANAARATLLRALASFGAGLLLVLALGVGYFAVNGALALADWLAQVRYDISTFHQVALAYRLEWFRTLFIEEAVAFVSFGNTPTAGFKDTVTQMSVLGRGFPFVFLLMTLGALFGLARRTTRRQTLFALGYFALTVSLCLWQGHFYRYHFLIVLPAMALLASVGAWRFARRSQSTIGNRQSAIANLQSLIAASLLMAAIVGLIAAVWPWTRDALENALMQRKPAEALYLESKQAPDLLAARALSAQTAPNERIAVFSDVPALYALAQRQNSTRFPYLRWAQEAGDPVLRDLYAQQFLADLQRQPPRFFVLTQAGYPWPSADFIALWKSLPAIHQYIEANYHYVGENGPYLLFQRNSN